jgi:hypothetical protein
LLRVSPLVFGHGFKSRFKHELIWSLQLIHTDEVRFLPRQAGAFNDGVDLAAIRNQVAVWQQRAKSEAKPANRAALASLLEAEIQQAIANSWIVPRK